MKYFLIITLLCASVCSQARTITKCGYPFKSFAMTAAVMEAQTVIGDLEETPLWSLTTFSQEANGNWCFSMPVTHLMNPLPSPTPNSVLEYNQSLKAVCTFFGDEQQRSTFWATKIYIIPIFEDQVWQDDGMGQGHWMYFMSYYSPFGC